ncbi:MAG: methyltransferase domain-containing protein [Propionibacteriaceae bacterium]
MTDSSNPAGNPVPTWTCRSCRSAAGPDAVVLELGEMPAADHFPAPGDPGPDPAYGLSMWCCPECGLAQLTADPTSADEPRGVEPAALQEQAVAAVADVVAAGLLDGLAAQTVTEFGSPHGGSWLGLFADRGWSQTDGPASLVVDCFGIMHEPDQRAAAQARADAVAPGGLLLVQFHTVEAIVTGGQWNALRHGHFAYYSLASLTRLFAPAGLHPLRAFEYALYGGTVLVVFAAIGDPDHPSLETIRAREREAVGPAGLRTLQGAADQETAELLGALEALVGAGRQVYGYGAASRAVALLSRAGVTPHELVAVADASVAKQGRALPGSRIPIVGPDELVAAHPDVVLLLLPDLLPEVSRAYPTLAGRWRTTRQLTAC